MLDDKDITEFQTLFKLEFGKEISKEEALKQAVSLITLFKHVYKPILKKK